MTLNKKNVIKIHLKSKDHEYSPTYIVTNSISKYFEEKIYYRFDSIDNPGRNLTHLTISNSFGYSYEILNKIDIKITLKNYPINKRYVEDLFIFNIYEGRNDDTMYISTYTKTNDTEDGTYDPIIMKDTTEEITHPLKIQTFKNINMRMLDNISNYKKAKGREIEDMNYLFDLFTENINKYFKDDGYELVVEIPTDKELKQLEMENELT